MRLNVEGTSSNHFPRCKGYLLWRLLHLQNEVRLPCLYGQPRPLSQASETRACSGEMICNLSPKLYHVLRHLFPFRTGFWETPPGGPPPHSVGRFKHIAFSVSYTAESGSFCKAVERQHVARTDELQYWSFRVALPCTRLQWAVLRCSEWRCHVVRCPRVV